ncbi:Multidrug resistance protein 3 [Tolypocladium ophioglossoides CBS 100239]|uniref:Multidrug resistance protein 3 n=1 Tax=Tolypocladium ophioglossoides (strain CBS 100239) TaxID=1163406 RepID=A0A0L0NEG8_TOLOC|nr:Multidrug resistance protein 3 [Tolypocladium ophioglossoides CBS 100239]
MAEENMKTLRAAQSFDSVDSDGSIKKPPQQMSNVKLGLVLSGLWLSLFLCSLETTIVSTSIVHISNDLGEFSDASCIVVGYLLTYNAFILIWSKLSDTFGTKWLLLLANGIFCVFSIACAVSKTMIQLIVFRAFQGIGGSGMYSVVFVVLAETVSMEKLGLCMGVMSSCFALASLLGPILGGVISDNSSWRWIFWLNVPCIALVFAVLAKFMDSPKSNQEIRSSLKRMDLVGALLSLAWAVPLIFALQEGGKTYGWNSGVIIGTLVTGVIMLVVFGFWQFWTYRKTCIDSILPVHLFKKAKVVLAFVGMFFLGFTFYVSVIQIPQRFQQVNNTTATQAGILLLPLTFISPLTSVFVGSAIGKHPLLAPGFVVAGGCLNLVGATLMSILPIDSTMPRAQFGYQVIFGISMGFMSALVYLIRVGVEKEDIAGAMGVGNMGRTLGGCIGLAVSGSIIQARLERDLPEFLNAQQLKAIEASLSAALGSLTEEQQRRVREVFGEGFNSQFKGLMVSAGLSIIAAVWLYFAYRGLAKTRQIREKGPGTEA